MMEGARRNGMYNEEQFLKDLLYQHGVPIQRYEARAVRTCYLAFEPEKVLSRPEFDGTTLDIIEKVVVWENGHKKKFDWKKIGHNELEAYVEKMENWDDLTRGEVTEKFDAEKDGQNMINEDAVGVEKLILDEDIEDDPSLAENTEESSKVKNAPPKEKNSAKKAVVGTARRRSTAYTQQCRYWAGLNVFGKFQQPIQIRNAATVSNVDHLKTRVASGQFDVAEYKKMLWQQELWEKHGIKPYYLDVKRWNLHRVLLHGSRNETDFVREAFLHSKLSPPALEDPANDQYWSHVDTGTHRINLNPELSEGRELAASYYKFRKNETSIAWNSATPPWDIHFKKFHREWIGREDDDELSAEETRIIDGKWPHRYGAQTWMNGAHPQFYEMEAWIESGTGHLMLGRLDWKGPSRTGQQMLQIYTQNRWDIDAKRLIWLREEVQMAANNFLEDHVVNFVTDAAHLAGWDKDRTEEHVMRVLKCMMECIRSLGEDKFGNDSEQLLDKWTKPNSYFDKPTGSTLKEINNKVLATFTHGGEGFSEIRDGEEVYDVGYDQDGHYEVTGQISTNQGEILWSDKKRRVAMMTHKEKWTFRESVDWIIDMETARATRIYMAVCRLLGRGELIRTFYRVASDQTDSQEYVAPEEVPAHIHGIPEQIEFFETVRDSLASKFQDTPDIEALVQGAVEPKGYENGDFKVDPKELYISQPSRIANDPQRKPMIFTLVHKDEETVQTLSLRNLYQHIQSEQVDHFYDRYPPLNGRLTEFRYTMLDLQRRTS